MPKDLRLLHLTAALRYGSDTFVFGAQSAPCYFDDAQTVVEDPTGFDVTRRLRVATVATGSVTGLVEDAAVSVRTSVTGAPVTTRYVVRKVLPAEDGLLTRVILAEADA